MARCGRSRGSFWVRGCFLMISSSGNSVGRGVSSSWSERGYEKSGATIVR
jgi:hypothetical protein